MTHSEKMTDVEIKDYFKLLLGEGVEMPNEITTDVLCN